MNPNSEIYGAPETWQNAYNASGINNAIGTALKCGKIKVPNFDTPNTGTYITSQIRTAVSTNKITANVAIDNSICAVGQGDKSPFKKIGCHFYDENNNTWYGPYITDIPTPVNMFPYETYSANGLQGIGGGATNINFATTSTGQVQIWSEGGLEYKNIGTVRYYNANWRLAPFTYYQLKSIVLQVLVNYTTNTTEPMTDAGLNEDHWITLDSWKNTYSQYPIVGCMVRMISANQIVGDNIGYYNFVGDNNSPYRSAFGLALNHPLKHNDTDTLASYTTFKMSQLTSEVVIFNKLYNGGGWGKYSKLFLPMWDKFSQYLQKPSRKCVLYRIPYSDTVYEDLMQAVASLGFCFTPTSKTSFNVNFTDADMCIPVIDNNGITTGEYTRGSDNINNDLYNADSVRDKGYNPDTPPVPVDPNTYSNTTGFNSIAAGASATIKYVLDSSNVRQLLTDLWTISHNIAGADYEKYDYKILDSFLVSNPIDSIVSIKRFPFEIPHTFSPQKTNVCLGKNTGSAQGYITYDIANTVVFSGVQIFPKFGNSFLDYAPYTEYELYIPFCGTVKLNAGDILGHTLNCRLRIDLTTGACVAYIMADELVIETASGVVSCELQVAGTDSATVDSNIQNAVLNHIGARTNKEIAMLSPLTFGGLLSAVSNPVKMSGAMENANTEISRADYNLTHIQTPVHSMGNAGGLTGWYQEFTARLIIYYPEGEAIDSSAPVSSTSPHLADLTAYAHNVGFACVMNGTVSEFHGKTVGNIDTSSIVGATEEERAQIKALFAQGVWLP